MPEKDPVIQIANMVVRQGEKDPFIRTVFTLDTCAPIVGADVISFKTEDELLKVWLKFSFVVADIYLGCLYNILRVNQNYFKNLCIHVYLFLYVYSG